MMQAVEKIVYSPADYLTQEVESSERHEYINGEIIPLTGGTPAHNSLALNLASELRVALKRQPYRVFITDQRLAIPAANIYTYPDVMVLPEPIETVPNRTDTVINPILIAEVLSHSTRRYDSVEKFANYRTIATFQEYLLIDQYRLQVEQYLKTTAGKWLFIHYQQPDDVIEFQCFEHSMTVLDLYDKVAWDGGER
jgi:Uma2 family endonuclease